MGHFKVYIGLSGVYMGLCGALLRGCSTLLSVFVYTCKSGFCEGSRHERPVDLSI